MKRFALALLTCAATLTSGCDRMLTKPSLYNNSLNILVTRRNGDPIPGAQLVLYTGQRPMQYAQTGADGRFNFLQVPPGSYGIRLYGVPSGYVWASDVIGGPRSDVVSGLDVSPDKNFDTFAFQLVKVGPGTVVVTIHGKGGEVIPNAKVELYSPAKIVATSTTDASGRVTFPAVPFGNYGVAVTRPILYKDFVTFGDSAFYTTDGLLVEDGATINVNPVFARCAGTLKVSAVDEQGAPVAAATAAVFAFVGSLGVAQTDKTGSVSFTLPCTISMGVQITPPLGFTASQGRPVETIDGITMTNGASKAITFHLERH